MKPRKRVRLGDLLETSIAGHGFAYFQITHKHPEYGMLVRVLPGIHVSRPPNLKELVSRRTLWVAFSPVNLMIKPDLLSIVDNFPIPTDEQQFPLFKACNPLLDGRKDWFIWDGKESTHVGIALPIQHHDLPIEEIVDLKILEDRIVTGWHPRDDVLPGPPRGVRDRDQGRG